jgi:hypothetical protein
VSEKEKSVVWKKHFSGLCSDETGHSRDPKHWEMSRRGAFKRKLECCDTPISWKNMVNALKAMSSNKAPGLDGIPIELLQLVVDEEALHSKFHFHC